jgi:hypothetical protein
MRGDVEKKISVVGGDPRNRSANPSHHHKTSPLSSFLSIIIHLFPSLIISGGKA